MEMIGTSEESGEGKEEMFDFESSKIWMRRRAFELQLLLMEEKAKSAFPIWIKASREKMDHMGKLSNITEMSREASMLRKMSLETLQIDGDIDTGEEPLSSRIIIGGVNAGEDAEEVGGVPAATGEEIDEDDGDEEEFEKVLTIEEKVKAGDMDFTLSPYSDLIYFLQDQMQKLVESSFYSMEGKEIVRLWSGSEQILRSINKLQSIYAHINELRRSEPGLGEKLRLVSHSRSSIHESAAAEEEKQFAAYRRMWELRNGNKFEDLTSLSSMLFTHCAPGCMPWYAVVKTTLQICYIKVTELIDLEWPLKVYGIIIARDAIDNRRNPIFFCPRNGGQIVNQHDPFLHLTGPSRAILCEDPVSFEIQLKLKGTIESEDRVLMSTTLSYNGDSADRFSTINIGNHFCKMELCCQQLEKSVQATIVSVRVVSQRPSSFLCGFRVVCSSLPRGFTDDDYPPSSQVRLLHDSRDEIINMDEHGYLDLPRHVVSAELRGKLKILIEAYAPFDGIDGVSGHVLFTPKKCNFSQDKCVVGDAEVEITVAWSLLVKDDECILSSSYVDPFEVCPPPHPSVLMTSLKMGVSEK